MDQNNKHISSECRCCLSKGEHYDLYKKYPMNSQLESMADTFLKCFNLSLLANPHISSSICRVCIQRLQDAQEFRAQVLKNDNILLSALGNNKFINFQNVLQDPLQIETDIKCEIKLEPNIDEIDVDITVDDIDQYDEDLSSPSEDVSGETRLLRRFSTVGRLPNRESLIDLCPTFYGHLENLKDKIITANTIQIIDTTKSATSKQSKSSKLRKPNRLSKDIFVDHKQNYHSEKTALAHNAKTLIENSNATVFKSKIRFGFPCFYCRNIFNNPKDLREHQNSHRKSLLFKLLTKYPADALIVYADVTNLTCNICNVAIPAFKDLKEHLINRHDKKMFQVADRVIPFVLGDNESDFDCHLCGNHFETFRPLEMHMNTHYRNFVCETCGAGFITKHRLQLHIRMHHSDNKIISCEVCNKVFLNKHKYKNHYDFVHKKTLRVKCPECDEKFVDHYTRRRHLELKHGSEPVLYKCSGCDKTFNRKHSLTMHFKRIHEENKDVQCDLCPFMCFTKSELKGHMYKHFGQKNFQCDVCMKTFMRKKSMNLHKRIHNAVTRYSCHICGETFVQNWCLQSHLKAHAAE